MGRDPAVFRTTVVRLGVVPKPICLDFGGQAVCQHHPPCPTSEALDREAARVMAAHPEQGWSLLCNGVVLFDDTGELLPGGEIIAPHRPIGALS